MKKTLLLAGIFYQSLAIAQSLTSYVDPFLGTGGHGHVFPGATVPFGMVQLSPDNGVEGWDWSSGYHYSSNTISGFSHTHLSGTGIGDWCDISVLPLTDTNDIRKELIKIPFSHKNEKAEPGFYKVALHNGVDCELTATNRTGFHLYKFPNETGWLRFDMGFHINWDMPTKGMIQKLNDSTIIGYRFSTGWAKNQRIYFAARFSVPIEELVFVDDSIRSLNKAEGKSVKAVLKFICGQALLVRVALSSVNTDKALKELNASANIKFNKVRENAHKLWERELNKIKIQATDRNLLTKFYTALYHTCLAPVTYSDKDGEYQTYSGKKVSFNKGKIKYTEFSQWDVFRAEFPLFTLIQSARLPDMINSLLQFYEDYGYLPVWDLSTWEANTMTGYHSIPIISDAILKNIRGFNYENAYKAMLTSAFQHQRGTQDYIQYGYVPQDKHGWSVTSTLEYAFDDWCIAQVAKKLGKKSDYRLFTKRSKNYKNLFDKQTGFFRSKNSKGEFIEPFDPLLSEHGFDGQYIEGTAWQHSFFVPQDISGLTKLFGGKDKLVDKLDQLFTAPSELHGTNVSADVTGLIGQYAHGNEPSHHIIYMYTALGHPEKAAKWIHIVADSMYQTGPDGLTGNDDCGQMSAWYVWTCLGMYPMNPAAGEYIFGVPLVDNARIELPTGKTLEIVVKRNSHTKDAAIKKVKWNNKEIPVLSIRHEELIQGGKLEFYL